MKKNTLFKTLIDILIIVQLPVIIGMIILLPTGLTHNKDYVLVENWNYTHWGLIAFNILTYALFLKGIFHLRNVARFLLSNNVFTTQLIINIKKCGVLFSLTGLAHVLLILTVTVSELIIGKISISHNPKSFSSLFLIIIGLFFILQSNTLLQAKEYKEENELTV